jgi:POTRA domain, FtsQ-type
MTKHDQTTAGTDNRRRSEDIRRRRSAQSHAAPPKERRFSSILGNSAGRSSSKRRTAGVAGIPPVMARGFSTSPAPAAKARGHNNRRLYNISLNAQGAEMRLPALPRLGFSWRIASLLMLAFLGGILYYFWTSPEFQVGEAEISGLQRMTRGDVNKALALSGAPIFGLDAGQIQNQLVDTFPEFSQVSVQTELPNTLLITVTERVPVLIWRQDGSSKLLDSEGMTFPARDEADLSAYPVIEASGDPPAVPGSKEILTTDNGTHVALDKILTDSLTLGLPLKGEAAHYLAPQTVAAILKIVDQAPNGAQVIYEPVKGFGWLDRRGWKVFLGDVSQGDLAQIDAKLQVYRAILEQVRAAGEKPAMINVEYLHVPYYTLEPSE